jgi:hypothetical protein
MKKTRAAAVTATLQLKRVVVLEPERFNWDEEMHAKMREWYTARFDQAIFDACRGAAE